MIYLPLIPLYTEGYYHLNIHFMLNTIAPALHMTNETYFYYGLKIDGRDSLESIADKWSSRTSHSYIKMDLPTSWYSKTLWRNCKNGIICHVSEKIIGSAIKEKLPVIENYVRVDNLSLVAQKRLSLEYLSPRHEELALFINKDSTTALANTQRLQIEIQHEMHLSSFLHESTPVEEPLSQRFKQLDGYLRASDWMSGCIALREIKQNNLFKFGGFTNFADYCKSLEKIGLHEANRRVRLAEVIERFESSGVPSPNNKGQATIFIDIPVDNQVPVWQKALSLAAERQCKLSAKLVNEAHAMILDMPPEVCAIGDDLVLKAKDTGGFASEAIAAFLNKVPDNLSQCTKLEAKIIKLIASNKG